MKILHEVVATFDLEPIDAGEVEESFKFRIEILREITKPRSYFARIYRWETFRIQPTFPILEDGMKQEAADHEVLVLDDMIGSERITGSTKSSVLEKVRKRIENCFLHVV